jgi:hypothetical protein
MRSARLLIAVGVLVVGAGLGCSSDSLTDPNAPPGLTIKLSPSVLTMFLTGTVPTATPVPLTLTATSLGRPVQAPTGVEWTSSNPAVAVVTDGVVRAVGPGQTTVTARVNAERATATVIVALRTSQQPLTTISQ